VRKVLVGLVVAVAVLVLAVVGVLVLVTLNLDPLVNEQRDKVAQIATDRLGRQATFGPVSTGWKGGLSAQLTQIQLAGRDDKAPPQLSLDAVRLKVNLWRAITSMGKSLEVDAFILERPVIRVSRDKDGNWDFDDIPKRLAASSGATPPEEAPPEETGPTDFSGLRIAGVAIVDGRVELDDQMLGRRLVIDKLDLTLSEIVPGHDVKALLGLILDDGQNKTPLGVNVSLMPLPADLNFDPLPALSAALKLGDLDLAPWVALLPKGVMGPSAGRLSIDLSANATRGLESAVAKGFVKVDGLVLAKGAARGQTSDIRVDVDVDADLKKNRIDVNRLDVTAPSVTLQTRVNLTEPSLDGIKNAMVELKVQNLARVMGILPAGSGMLPKQLVMEGPFEVNLKGDPKQAALKVDLDRAHVGWEGAMDKPANTPLHLTVVANRAGDRIKLDPVELVLDTAKLGGVVDASTKKGAPLNASLDTGPVVLASLKGIFPAFAKALQKGDKVDGTIRLSANARAAGDKQEVHANLVLKGMDVNLAQTTVKGDARITADVAPQGNGVTTAGLDATLDGLAVKQVDDKRVALVDKPMGMVMGVMVKVVHSGQDVSVDQADVRLGKTVIAARGKVEGLDKPSPNLDVKVEKLDISFDDVRAVAAAARVLPAGGRLAGRVVFTGNPKVNRSMVARVENLELTAAKNRVAGDIAVRDLDSPTLDVNLTTVDLNFDELRKLAQSDAIPAGGTLKAKVVVTGNVTKLSTLVAKVDDLDASVFKSAIKGHVHFRDVDAPKFDVKLKADRVDVNEILRATGGGKKEEPKQGAKPAPADQGEPARGLPKETRDMLRKVDGVADLDVGKILYDKYTVDNFKGVVKVKDGVITIDRLDLGIYEGRIVATGTRVDAGAAVLASKLSLKVTGLNVGQAVDAHADQKGAVSGRLDLETDVKASGMGGKEILNTLEGPISLSSRELTLNGGNLMGSVAESVAGSSPLVAKVIKPQALPGGGATKFLDLKGEGRFEAGKVVLVKPMTSRTPFGEVSMAGDIRFDQRLNLLASATITPDTIAKLTGNKFRPRDPVRTPVKIGGTLTRPVVESVDVGAFLKGAGMDNLLGAAAAAAEEARKRMEEEARKAAEQADRIKREAEARASAEAQKAADEARRQAEEARRRAEEAARKQAEDAKKRAEEEAKKAAQKAQDEAKRKAEEAKKKAEDKLKSWLK
jgi:hypothetical protein